MTLMNKISNLLTHNLFQVDEECSDACADALVVFVEECLEYVEGKGFKQYWVVLELLTDSTPVFVYHFCVVEPSSSAESIASLKLEVKIQNSELAVFVEQQLPDEIINDKFVFKRFTPCLQNKLVIQSNGDP